MSLRKRGGVSEACCAWCAASLKTSEWRKLCVSRQEGETDPLSSLELARSQESVTWVGQLESARRNCLALYLLPVAASSLGPASSGRTADLKTDGDYKHMTVIFPQYAAEYAVPGLQAWIQSKVPHCLFDQLEGASAGQGSDLLLRAARHF